MPEWLKNSRLWFALTREERLFLGGILLIVLVGLTARYVHLKNQKPEPYEPVTQEMRR
jgi:hypothetical protein